MTRELESGVSILRASRMRACRGGDVAASADPGAERHPGRPEAEPAVDAEAFAAFAEADGGEPTPLRGLNLAPEMDAEGGVISGTRLRESTALQAVCTALRCRAASRGVAIVTTGGGISASSRAIATLARIVELSVSSLYPCQASSFAGRRPERLHWRQSKDRCELDGVRGGEHPLAIPLGVGAAGWPAAPLAKAASSATWIPMPFLFWPDFALPNTLVHPVPPAGEEELMVSAATPSGTPINPSPRNRRRAATASGLGAGRPVVPSIPASIVLVVGTLLA
eukprot:scaffold211631_cov26-Tisochrysis_lutea.AAC.3